MILLLVQDATWGCWAVLLLQTAWFRLILLLPWAAAAPGPGRNHLEKTTKPFLLKNMLLEEKVNWAKPPWAFGRVVLKLLFPFLVAFGQRWVPHEAASQPPPVNQGRAASVAAPEWSMAAPSPPVSSLGCASFPKETKLCSFWREIPWLRVRLGWNEMVSKVLSIPNHSMFLWW